MLRIEASRRKGGVALKDLRVGQCFTMDDLSMNGRHFRKTDQTIADGKKLKCYCFEDNLMKFYCILTRVKPCKLKLTHDEDESCMERPQVRTIKAQELCPGDRFRTPQGHTVYVRVSNYAEERWKDTSGHIVGVALHNGNAKSFHWNTDIVPVQHGETN